MDYVSPKKSGFSLVEVSKLNELFQLMSGPSANNKRIAKNTIFLYIRMFFALIVSLYTSRVVLQTLGVVDYGVYNVVAGFVSLFSFLNATLSASMQRFYNYELGAVGDNGVAGIYVTGLRVHLIFAAIVVLLLETFGIWYVNHIMVVPPERLFAANVQFQVAVIALVCLILQIPYVGLIMAYEKFDYYAIVSVIEVVLKLLIVLVLPLFPYDKLIVYALLTLVVSVGAFLLYYIYSLRYFSFVFHTDSQFDRATFRKMSVFAGWNMVGTFAYIFKYQGVNLLLNFYFGPIVNAARGVAYQVQNAVMGFSGNITTAFRPQVVNSYAANDIKHAVNLVFMESKVCFVLLSTLIVPLIFELNYVLHLWLGDVVPLDTQLFTALVLVDGLVTCLIPPCNHIMFATGKLKYYQISASIINMLLIPAAWAGLHLGYDAEYVFGLLIIFSIINLASCVYFSNREVHFGIWRYVREVVVPFIFCVVIDALCLFPIYYFLPSSFGRLLLICIASVCVNILLSLFVILKKSEREHVLLLIRNKIKR